MAKAESRAVLNVITPAVQKALSPEELERSLRALQEKSKTPDPESPNLWTHQTGKHVVWAILDEQAGPEGEDVLTILLPGNY